MSNSSHSAQQPELPPEVLLSIFKMVFWEHREELYSSNAMIRELNGDTRGPTITETDWCKSDNVTSSSVFPTSPASVSKDWRRVMSMFTIAWTRIVIFTDAPECLTFARSQLEWSLPSNTPIDLIVSNPDSKPFPGSPEEERVLVRRIIDIVKPHFERCRTIHFNLTYTSSLPRLAADFLSVAPHLKKVRLHAHVRNGLSGFMDGTSPTVFPFPVLEELDIDGWNFVDIAMNAKWWLEDLGKTETRHRSLSVTGYTPTVAGNLKETRFLINDVLPILDQFSSLNLCDVDFDSTVPERGEDHFTYNSSLRFIGLSASLTSALLYHRDTESISLTRCSLTETSYPYTSYLTLRDIDYPHSARDLYRILKNWEGLELHVVNCPGFDDAVLALFGESIPARHSGELVMRGEIFSSLNIENCHGFSIAALRNMVESRKAFSAAYRGQHPSSDEYPEIDVWVRNVPALDAEDRSWFRRMFGVHTLSAHDCDLMERTGVYPAAADEPFKP